MSVQAVSPNDLTDIANQFTSKTSRAKEKNWLCDRCGCVYLHRESFVHHMVMHTSPIEMLYKCEFCDLSFQPLCALINHRKVHQKNPLKCEKCGKVFTRKVNYLGHMLIHEGKEPIKCDLCGDEFPYKSSLKDHMRTHTGEHFACKICGKQLYCKNYLNNHMKLHCAYRNKTVKHCQNSNETVRTFAMDSKLHGDRDQCDCSICKTVPQKFKKFRMRPAPQHYSFLKLFSCTECNVKFYTVKSLQRHMKFKHKVNDVKEYYCKDKTTVSSKSVLELQLTTNEAKKVHQCDICDMSYSSPVCLAEHVNVKHKDEFKCGHCNAAFGMKNQLETHVMTHTTRTQVSKSNLKLQLYCKDKTTVSSKSVLELQLTRNEAKKAYKCDICDMSYSSSVHLAEHVYVKHDEDMFKCGHCNAAFRRKNQLEMHVMTHATRTEVSKVGRERKLPKFNPKKPFQCTICYMRYSSEVGLLCHQRLHNGILQLPCQTCNAIFSTVEEYVNHQSSHGDLKPFQCGFCNISFCSEKFFTVHLRTCQAKKEYIDTKMQHRI